MKSSLFSNLNGLFSRRGFIAGVGSAGGGIMLGSVLSPRAFADDDDNEGHRNSVDLGLCESPNAIPHVNKATIGAGKFHFYFPGNVEGTLAATDHEPGGTQPGGRDPSTIYNFKGLIGQVDLDLTGKGTNLNTGVTQPYGFHTDTRFMTGVFIGTDGRQHQATLAEVWLDSTGSASPHSYDLGISRDGVFWTTAMPEDSVTVEFDEGEALLHLRNVCVQDTFTTGNSLNQGSILGHPVAAVINSLKINWSGIIRRVSGFHSASTSDDQFAGDFIENSATIEVDVTTLPSTGHGFHFVSNPAHTTVSNFAQIGRERNGAFV